eukprot:TRINITY_DN3478_c0_g2_i1.p1 TRINITY_DN3478_c0_g2~~TRINITY_DN3478_c0_g2_i1.p1  ORF type:complete len:207 (-),score=45.21 TRINITY_DN3478_c0_g2_i1:136-756(-)
MCIRDRYTLEDILKLNKKFALNLLLKDTEGANRLLKHLNTITGSMPGAAKRTITLYNCFDAFSKEEQLDSANLWDCENCKTKVQAIKSATLCSLPPILIIHLKRFKQRMLYHYSTSKKVAEYVEYPIEGLELGKYVGEEYKSKARYNLFGVTNHIGDTGGGHYTAICKNSISNIWMEFDDQRVLKAKESSIVTEFGYILYYRRADL